MDFRAVADVSAHDLRADIAEIGLKQPIVVHHGKMVDGRHRYRAGVAFGIEPSFVQWDPNGYLVNFILSINSHRQNTSLAPRGGVGVPGCQEGPFCGPSVQSEYRRRVTVA